MTRQPRLPESEVRAILDANGVDQKHVSVLAIRGYYLDSIGRRGVNDRGVYDDAHFIWWPDGMAAFLANTDPSGYRKGHGKGANKGMAMIAPGVWTYGTGLHKGTLAFRQCEPFLVIRDGDPPYEDLGWHATNWHAGGNTSTSSLGCQTNPASLFQTEVRPLVYALLDRYNNPKRKNDRDQIVRSFSYVLLNETDRRQGKFTAGT